MSRREQNSDESGAVRCRRTDTGIAYPRLSERSDWHSPRERDAKISFSSEHPLMAVVELEARSRTTEHMDEKGNE